MDKPIQISINKGTFVDCNFNLTSERGGKSSHPLKIKDLEKIRVKISLFLDMHKATNEAN